MIKLFTTSYCGPCRAVKNHLKEIGVEFELVDLDIHPFEAEYYDISNIPTILVLDDDENELKRIVGAFTKERLQEILSTRDDG